MIHADTILSVLDIQLLKFLDDYGLYSVMYSGIKWAVIGLACGFFFGIFAFIAIRSLKGYAMSTCTRKWPQVILLALTLSLSVLAGGYIGFIEGLWRGSQAAIHSDKFRSEILSISGEVGSLAVACVYCVDIKNVDGRIVLSNEQEVLERLETFREGKWEIDVQQLDDRLHRTTEKIAEPLNNIVYAEAIRTWPSLGEGIPNRFLRWFLASMGRALAARKIEKDLDELGVLPYFRNVLGGIRNRAALAGDVNTIAHQELSVYIAEEQILTFLEEHVQKYFRSQQALAFSVLMFFLALPAVIIRLAERLRLKHSKPKV